MDGTTIRPGSDSSAQGAGLSEGAVPTVHVVDDDEGVRASLSNLLASVGLIPRTYASGDEFLATYTPSHPECALVDERMPGVSGIALLDVMRERGIILPVIVITGFPDVEMAVDAMRRGAFDFLCKPFREQELLDDVYKAVQNDSTLCKEHKERLEFERHLSRLTPRERDVLELVATGAVNRGIATELGISKRTVEVHRVRLMKKMQVGSVAELAMLKERFGTKQSKRQKH
jgi:two-component system response regulator FixJ